MTLDAVLLADLAIWTTLQEAGWRPDLVAGQSFGEHAALVAAVRVADVAGLVRVLGDLRALADRRAPVDEDGRGMLALTAASRPLLAPLLAADPPRVRVALDNCPQQIVVWGDAATLATLEADVQARRQVAFRLPDLDRGVHTPGFPLPYEEILEAYRRVAIADGTTPVWSATHMAPMPEAAADVREWMARQWHAPVRFRELVTRLYDEGVRTFVEVGPGDRLSGFVRDTLRGTGVATLPANLEGRPTVPQVLATLAQLFVRGHDIRPDVVRDAPREAAPDAPRIVATRASHAGTDADAHAGLVAGLVAGLLGVPSLDEGDVDRGFFELGLGSMGCLALVSALEGELSRTIPQTLPFDHPTVRRLAAALAPGAGAHAARRARASAPSASPIAIVGIGCRFPGGDGPDAFWEALASGRDAIDDVPPDRESAAFLDPDADDDVRRRQTRGAYLDDIRGFDAPFFGISPREAEALDPQQRLLLEVAWEALEHASIDPSTLAGTSTGVFVGISHADYATRLTPAERLAVGGYLGMGNTHSTAAGRLSYVLGLAGPCLAVDTACSSSLAAVHLASASLRRGECDAALAGGVQLLVSAESTVYLSRARALSPTGRCRTFDAAADGYARGEGAGLIVLKRLDDAIAAGDRVLAVIRGSAMNHDGRTSGLTVPNGLAQEAVIRAALADAEVAPARVSFVEAHGTGTPLGDPIEIGALARVFAGERDAGAPLWLGAVKTAIGHLEAAAGIAGLIKTVLQLRHRRLAPTLHFTTPNPRADWRPGLVVAGAEAWPSAGTRVGGVSAFGISGTNVHVVVEEAGAGAGFEDAAEEAGDGEALAVVLPVSARSGAALGTLARRLADHLERASTPLPAVARTLGTGRAHFGIRKAVVARDAREAVAALRAIDGAAAPRAAGHARVAWLFAGQGAQRPGMGRRLYAVEPVFRDAVDACDARVRPLLGESIAAVMFADDARLAGTGLAQPALFTLEYALAALWRHRGVRPAVVAGHSVGEIAAAVVAGVMSLDDGARLVAARARLMQALPAGGGMLAVDGDAAAVVSLAAEAGVAVAAVNAPDQVVLSGATDAIDAARRRCEGLGFRATRLIVSHAFHSPLMASIAGPLREVAATIALRAPDIPMVAGVTGRLAGPEIATPDYWVSQALEPVRFAGVVQAIAAAGVAASLELGPSPVLTALAMRAPEARGVAWITSLAPTQPDDVAVGHALAGLFEAGVPIDWRNVTGTGARPALPTYPFEREPYWIEAGGDPAATGGGERRKAEAATTRSDDRQRDMPFSARLAATPPDARCRLIEAFVAGTLGVILKQPPDRPVPADEALTRLGVDSLMAFQLSVVVERECGVTIPVAAIVDGASVATLAAAVTDAVRRGAGAARVETARTAWVDGDL
ncbi:MAG: beta-ketoacyl synthase N-terminal-like domain-containing protein [Vicinamibacteria bacterium]